MNASTSKDMRWSRYVNEGRIDVRLNGEPLEELNCLKYLGPQVTADRRCDWDVVHIPKALRALKSLLGNRRLGMNAKKCLYEGEIVQ